MTELDVKRVPSHTGRDVDNAAPTEAEHHTYQPGYGFAHPRCGLAPPPWNYCRVRALEWSGALRRC